MSNINTHCNSYVLFDEHTGDHICKHGFVQPFQFDTGNHFARSMPKLEEEIISVCDRNFISKSICDDACFLYSKTLKYHYRGKKYNMAFCLYKACIKHHVPRSMGEIAQYFNICKKTFSNIPSQFQCDEVFPSHLAPRVYHSLGLTDFKKLERVKKRADELYYNILSSSPPESVLAIALLLETDCDAHDVANVCCVSYACVQRLKIKALSQ